MTGSRAAIDPYASAIVARVLAVPDGAVRAAWLRATLATFSPMRAGDTLAAICARAERGDPSSREVLAAVARVLADPSTCVLRERLCVEARERGPGPLGRFLGVWVPAEVARPDVPPARGPLATATAGRALTLGERKALARKPDRRTLDRLLADPHPAVIAILLNNPRLTEDDVVRIAAYRPGSAEVLSAVAGHARWAPRARVRRALMLNPATPAAAAHPLLALVGKPDLMMVESSLELPPERRAAARRVREARAGSVEGRRG